MVLLLSPMAFSDPSPEGASPMPAEARPASGGGLLEVLSKPVEYEFEPVQAPPAGSLGLSDPPLAICAATTPRDPALEPLLIGLFPESCRDLLPRDGHVRVSLVVKRIAQGQAVYSTEEPVLATCLAKSQPFLNARHEVLMGAPRAADYNLGAVCQADRGKLTGAGKL